MEQLKHYFQLTVQLLEYLFLQVYNWLSVHHLWLIALLLQGFIAYHVFFLSKRITLRNKLLHRDEMRKHLDFHLAEIETRGIRRKMVLVNAKKVGKRGEKNSEAYSEIKTTTSDGVEFFGFISEDEDGNKIYPVYLLPYEFIIHIDLRGDDCDWLPTIICKFKGMKKTPWKEIRYYKESSVYHEGNDPIDMKYQRIYDYEK